MLDSGLPDWGGEVGGWGGQPGSIQFRWMSAQDDVKMYTSCYV